MTGLPSASDAPRRDALVAELSAGLDRVTAVYRALSPPALELRVYDDGAKWTVKQVLAHLITVERTMPFLWKAILAGTSAASSAEFDLERFNRTQPAKLDPLTLDQLLARLADVRAASIERVAALAEGDLDRVGVHPFLGEGTVERFVTWAWVHADGHLADVRGVMSASAEISAAPNDATAARRATGETPEP